jgi:hypothetical protein
VIKKKVFFFKDVECDNDLGWLFPEVKKNKTFTFYWFFEDFFCKPEEVHQNVTPDKNTFIYLNSLYFKKNPYYYKRSFMKLQDLAAVVRDLLNSVIEGFVLFAQIYNSLTMKKYFILLINSL